MIKDIQFSVSKKVYLIFVLIISTFIIISSYIYYGIEAENVRTEKYNQLRAVAELKTNQLVEWRSSTFSQVSVTSQSPVLTNTVQIFLNYPTFYRKELIRRLRLDIDNYEYENILMTDTSGRILLNGVGRKEHLDDAVIPSFREALTNKKIVFSDFYKCPLSKKIHYDIIAPVIGESGRILTLLIFRLDPEIYFYPLIEKWPTPSKTSETVLFRRMEDSILFLTNLRKYKESALKLKIPLTRTDLPGVQAALGHTGIFKGKDYRDVDVLSFVGHVPNTPWYMVAKVDESELFAELTYKALLMIIFSILMLGFVWSLVGLLYNRKERVIYAKLLDAQREAQAVSEQRQLALDAAKLGWWHFNPLDGSVWCDDQFKKIFGFTSNPESVSLILSRIHPEDLPLVKAASKAAQDPEMRSLYSIEYRIIHDDGSVHWVESHGIVSFEGVGSEIHPVKFVGTVQDTTERKNLEEGLRRRVEELETIMDVAPVAIWISDDPHCNTIRGNKLANEFYQAKHGDNVSANSTSIRRFYRNGVELKAEELTMQRAARENIFIQNEEIDVLLPDGSWLYMIGSASPLRATDGSVRGCIAAFMDVTEIKLAQFKIEKTLKELQHSNRELEQFAYIASHDLQEPVRMIKVFIEMLKNKTTAADPHVDNYIKFISDGASRMHQLINALLDYSKLISHESDFEKQNCNEILQEVLTDLHLMIVESGVIITYDELPVISGNRTMLRQLFQNLIQNAIKFRKGSPPEIKIGCRQESGGYKFSFTDNGIGISSEYYEKIFLIFQKLHSNDVYPGTGIGLAACKKIAELHGGRIDVESIPGEGSTFYVTFPIPSDSKLALPENHLLTYIP